MLPSLVLRNPGVMGCCNDTDVVIGVVSSKDAEADVEAEAASTGIAISVHVADATDAADADEIDVTGSVDAGAAAAHVLSFSGAVCCTE